MYTQCPDCATAFRVTADILKQAGGKVRCGGCGIAFNALAYLSETKPEARRPPDNDDALPELTPDPAEEAEAPSPPRAISPEQSAALLKTLDELAGSDIRLEDTGVEWRLLDDNEDDDSEDAVQLPDETDTPVDAELSGDTGNTAIDEFLDDTPADVDEFLADAPGEVEASEVFAAADSQVDSAEIFDGAAGTGDVDENLDDIDDQVERPQARKSNELRFDDHTGLPDDDSEVAEAASVVAFEDHVEPEPEPEPEFIEPAAHIETQVDIVFGEPDEWGELLDEVEVAADDGEEAVEVRGEIIEPEVDENDRDAASVTIEDELDALEDEPVSAGEEFPESNGQLESELARAQNLSDRILSALSRHGVDDVDELDGEDERDDSSAAFDDLSLQLDDADDDADDLPELEVAAADDDDAFDDFDLGGDFNKPAAESPDIPEPVILPETEEEQTINRMIDQDLLRLAAGDDEPAADQPKHSIDVPGFPSMDSSVETIIMEGEFVRTALEQEALEAEAAREQDPEESSFIAAAKKTFRGKLTRHDEDDDTPGPKRNYRIAAGLALLGLLLAGQLVHQSRAALATIPAVNNVIAPIYRMIGSPITPRWDVTGWKFEVTRETLSGGEPVTTNPEAADDAVAEDDAIAEDAVADDDATADDTSGVEAARTPEILTIYSRLGNSAEHPLPYPLITVSLTDRYEETIGSTILEPADYLPAGSDTSRTISPGNTFEAVIPIESPSGNATGYKLNVCYRQAGNTLRCAVEDFK